MPLDAKRPPAEDRRPFKNHSASTTLDSKSSGGVSAGALRHGCRCDECLAHLLDKDRVKVLTTVAAVIGLDVDRMIGELLTEGWPIDDASEAITEYWRTRVVFLVDRALQTHLERRAS